MHFKSIIVGAHIFVLMVLISIPIGTWLKDYNIALLTVIIFTLWSIPGYIVAKLSKNNVVLNASISGVLSATIVVLLQFLFVGNGSSSQVSVAALLGAVICFGFGAVIWSIQKHIQGRHA